MDKPVYWLPTFIDEIIYSLRRISLIRLNRKILFLTNPYQTHSIDSSPPEVPLSFPSIGVDVVVVIIVVVVVVMVTGHSLGPETVPLTLILAESKVHSSVTVLIKTHASSMSSPLELFPLPGVQLKSKHLASVLSEVALCFSWHRAYCHQS